MKDDKSDSDDKNEAESGEEDGDENFEENEKSESKKTSDKKKSIANNDKKKTSSDAKKDDGKSTTSKNSNSTNDKKEDDDTPKSGSLNKKESAMSLGEITSIDNYITNTKVDGLQVLYSVSVFENFVEHFIKLGLILDLFYGRSQTEYDKKQIAKIQWI